MACMSYHKESERWLTSFGKNIMPGSEHTISSGHPLLGGEFTTYKLGEVAAYDAYGPLFDLESAEIQMPDGRFYPGYMIRAFASTKWDYPTITIGGVSYERNTFGHYKTARTRR